MEGKLILENGIILKGKAYGYKQTTIGEVVFNTSMTGYQEILTDPSYYGQIVVMTYPLIGNYGVNFQDLQSESIKVRGLITREVCDYPSNFRREMSLDKYMDAEKIFGLEDIDTRHLTKIIRKEGTLNGILTIKDISKEKEKELFENYSKKDFVKNVSTNKSYTIKGNGLK
ncbi:MAG: carbamoyl-phosphate synthase domain-containing protein, partial [bacterium]